MTGGAQGGGRPLDVAILSLGTRGDLELFLGLATALSGRGHRVRMGVAHYHVDAVRERGVEARAMHDYTRDQAVQAMVGVGSIADGVARTRAYYQRWLKREIDAARAHLPALVSDADYFVSNLKLQLSRGGERMPGAFVDYDPPVDLAAFRRLGTASAAHRRSILDLVALNRDLVDPQRQWPAQYRFTGFWQAPAPSAGGPAPALRAFIEAQAAPVVVTLGSMAMLDPRTVVDGIAAVTALTARRVVLVCGWSPYRDLAALAAAAGEGVLVVREAPYAWLFPRAACVVHHGGTGTVAAVLRAGRPSVVVPQIACQRIFGEILVREGLASAVVDLAGPGGAGLADAVHEAIANPRHTLLAQRWASALQRDGGLAEAVAQIERHGWALQRPSGTPR